jgi:hypothetical protein
LVPIFEIGLDAEMLGARRQVDRLIEELFCLDVVVDRQPAARRD